MIILVYYIFFLCSLRKLKTAQALCTFQGNIK